MIRLEYIVILVGLLRFGCLEARAHWYKITSNVAVDPNMCVDHESITDKISSKLCVHSCTKMQQVIIKITCILRKSILSTMYELEGIL